MKNINELRELSVDELNSRMLEFKKELFKMNVQVANGASPANSGKIKLLKKSIAVVTMLITDKTRGNK